jgi:hypothetical protein
MMSFSSAFPTLSIAIAGLSAILGHLQAPRPSIEPSVQVSEAMAPDLGVSELPTTDTAEPEQTGPSCFAGPCRISGDRCRITCPGPFGSAVCQCYDTVAVCRCQ